MSWKKFYLILFIAFAFSSSVIPADAAILEKGLISEVTNCGANGEQCSLNAFLRLGLSVSQYILGIVGALTLLMFIVGGVVLMLSGGSADKVKKGKDILIGSVIGLVIVFSSYLIIQFTTEKLLGGTFNANLPKETVMEREQDCTAAGGACVAYPTPGCSGAQLTKSDTKQCKKDIEKCCVSQKICVDMGGKCFSSCGSGDTEITGGVCALQGQKCCKVGSGSCLIAGYDCVESGACVAPNILRNSYTCNAPTPDCCDRQDNNEN